MANDLDVQSWCPEALIIPHRCFCHTASTLLMGSSTNEELNHDLRDHYPWEEMDPRGQGRF